MNKSRVKTAQTIRLKDGRLLGYAEFGDPEGKPIFFFHGWPGSRLEGKLIEEGATNHSIRLIGIDRPGMGLSDFKPKRTLLDWPDDVLELADALELESFSVIGISGGGPYALVCAYKIPIRLKAVGVIAGMGPISLGTKGMKRSNRMIFFFARMPWLLRLFGRLMVKIMCKRELKEKDFERMEKELPEADKKIFLDPNLQEIIIMGYCETFRSGTKGMSYEGKLYIKPWGFKLEEIPPNMKVNLWYGELDKNVPVRMGRAMAKAILNCKAKFYPEQGHISVVVNKIEEIFNTFDNL